MASGMPCPLIFDDPYLAMIPTIKSANYGNGDDPQPKMIVPSAGKVGYEVAVKGYVGQQADQFVQQESYTPGNQSNRGREK
jgi:hypothetical protein